MSTSTPPTSPLVYRFTLPNSLPIAWWRASSYCYHTLLFPAALCTLNYLLFGRLSKVGGGFTVAVCLALNCIAHRVAGLMVLPAGIPTTPWLPGLLELVRRHGGKAAEAMCKSAEDYCASSKATCSRSEAAMRAATSSAPVHLTAPDGVASTGWLYSPTSPAKGCVLYLGGNGEYAEQSMMHVRETWARRSGFGVLALNYRGVGASAAGQQATRDGIVLDALTALSFLLAPKEQGGLGLPPHRVLLVGHSLGGGIGALAAALSPQQGVTVISERSFGTLTEAAVCMLFPKLLPAYSLLPAASAAGASAVGGASAAPTRLTAAEPGGGLLGACVRTAFRLVMRHVCGWELDAAAAWPSLPKNTKVIVFAPDDGVVVFPASLAAAVTGVGSSRAPLPREQVGCLCKLGATTGFGEANGMAAHNKPLTEAELARLMPVCALASEPMPAGRVLGSGAVVPSERRELPSAC